MLTDRLSPVQDPEGAAHFRIYPFRSRVAEMSVIILYKELGGWMTRTQNDQVFESRPRASARCNPPPTRMFASLGSNSGDKVSRRLLLGTGLPPLR